MEAPAGGAVRAINGVAQVTTYDVLDRPAAVTNALGVFQYSYFDATARLASEAYPNGQTNLYTYYNNLGDERLQQIQHLYPNGSLLSGFGYGYNAVGQIAAWTNQWDTIPTRVWLPAYDAADQLTNIVSTGGPSPVNNYAYGYDSAGNRLLAATNGVQNTFTYNALNQLTSSIGVTNASTYEWDAENRLTAINNGSNRSEFYYDGLGQRTENIEKTNGGVWTNNYYLWCGTRICEVRDSTGANTLRRLYREGEQVLGQNYFYTRDHLGSIREVLDTNGAISTRYDYDPYGKQSTIQENLKTTFAYTGHFIHSPSKLYLTLYRALDSECGRWLSRDPIGLEGGINEYAYVKNEPVKLFDPLGKLWNVGPTLRTIFTAFRLVTTDPNDPTVFEPTPVEEKMQETARPPALPNQCTASSPPPPPVPPAPTPIEPIVAEPVIGPVEIEPVMMEPVAIEPLFIP